jgi:phosphatidylinositol alpha-mannosyltransferase
LNVVALGAWLLRIPVVVYAHASETNVVSRQLHRAWPRLLGSLATWVAVSEVARDVVVQTTRLPVDRVVIVPNPIDPAEVVARENPALSDAVVVGYLGSRHPVKGFNDLPTLVELTAGLPVRWRLFANKRPMGGTSNYLDPREATTWSDLERQELAGRVELCDRVTDTREAFAGVAILCAPSQQESFGRSVAEAMLNGIPVVATDIPAHRSLLGADVAGLLYSPGDLVTAASHVRRLAMDPALRRAMGEVGRERARAFEAGAVVRDFERLYERARSVHE